jgi:hypothetical protein
MKLLLLLFMSGISSREANMDRFPQSVRQSSSIPLECSAPEVAKMIRDSGKTPKNTIFHYGMRKFLMKDVAANNIPVADWNEYIMGLETTWGLKAFRRGLYGSEFPEDADKFGNSKANWMIEIELKPECLISSRVVSLLNLPQSEVFQKWYEQKACPTSFQNWKQACFDNDGKPRSRVFIDYTRPNEIADFSENFCEGTVTRYYDEQKFAFIHDYAGQLSRAWAIRDRECIAGIKGSDAYWVQAFATRPELWVNTCSADRNHRNNIRVWFSAIANAGISSSLLKQFSAMIKTVTAPDDRILDWETDEHDRFAVQDFVAELMSAQKCKTSVEFKNALNEIANSVDQEQSLEVKEKLESICR